MFRDVLNINDICKSSAATMWAMQYTISIPIMYKFRDFWWEFKVYFKSKCKVPVNANVGLGG